MKKYFTVFSIIYFTILSVSTYSQVKVVLTEGVPIYKASLFEKQLLQFSINEQPEKSTGKFSGLISDYRLQKDIGDFKFDTYSSPKSMIYGVIITRSKIEDSPEIERNFRKKFDDLAYSKFWYTFEYSDKLLKISDKPSYLLYLDSLEKLVSPYYNFVNKRGKELLDSISTLYSYISKTNSKIIRNTNVDKLSANKNWEPSFTLFDAFTDKPISIEKGNPPYYNLFIFNENDNIDSLLNLRLSDIQNGYSSTRRSWEYSVNKLSSIKGIKFQNIDNFYNWVKIKYPEKFVRTELSNSSKTQNSKATNIANKETSENKNLESFLKLLASSNNNSSRTQTISSNQSGKCNDCNGTGKCRGCNRVFQKPYFTNGYYNKRSEIKLGYTLCQSCMGKGFKDRSIGSGYQIIGDCPSSKCQDGWEGCYLCNLGGQRRDIGQCVKCRGTGRK